MGGRVLAGIAVAVAMPATAIASSGYFPKHGHACRSGYIRKTVKLRERREGKMITVKRAECTVKPRGATTTDVLAQLYPENNTPNTYFVVSGTVYDSSGNEKRGLPITYSIADATTNQPIATFAGTSNLAASCTVVVSLNSSGTVRTYTGQPVTPYPACALGTASMPAADDGLITVSFAGNSQYMPSKSSPQAFG